MGTHSHCALARRSLLHAQLKATAKHSVSFTKLTILRSVHPEIRSYVWRRLKSDEDADDLTSTTFLNAWKAIAGYKQSAPFSSWLYKIAHNACVRFMQRRSKHNKIQGGLPEELESIPDQYSWGIPHEAAERCENIRMVREALADLRPKYGVPVYLRYFEELDYQIVANEIGTSILNARVIVSRGLQSLRERIYAEYA
jgi:RNA polymerase sigma-70 factor, ECF subfamily